MGIVRPPKGSPRVEQRLCQSSLCGDGQDAQSGAGAITQAIERPRSVRGRTAELSRYFLKSRRITVSNRLRRRKVMRGKRKLKLSLLERMCTGKLNIQPLPVTDQIKPPTSPITGPVLTQNLPRTFI